MRAAGRSAGGWNTRRALASGPRHITVMLQCADAGRRVVASGNSRRAAIVLTQVSPEQAITVAGKLRQRVEGWQFPGVPRTVTISAGAAAFPQHGTTRDELVKAADSALYAAKQAGRNAVRLATAARCEAAKA